MYPYADQPREWLEHPGTARFLKEQHQVLDMQLAALIQRAAASSDPDVREVAAAYVQTRSLIYTLTGIAENEDEDGSQQD